MLHDTHLRDHDRTNQGGFTLIELLVVIIILGILSAVVVFAVRGVDDKGEAAAVTADERTIRTAQEAYCARFGRYATDEAYLVNPSLDPALAGQAPGTQGFLSEESETHDIGPSDPGQPKPCGGTGYKIIKLRNDGVDVPPPPPGKGTFADLPDPLSPVEVLVAMPNGKVLAWGEASDETYKYQLFDPVTSLWALIEPLPHPLGLAPLDYVVLLDDPSTPLSDCTPNCGSVLVKAPLLPWYLYNSDAAAGSPWTPVPGSSSYSSTSFFINGAVQLMDDPTTPDTTECGLICGHVFVTTDPINTADRNVPPVWELYDPHANSFTPFVYPAGEDREIASGGHTLASLRDGRVMLVGFNGQLARKVTKLFDPATLGFTNATDPTMRVEMNFEAPPPILANGDVLFKRVGTTKEIYRPERGGPGEWLDVDSCGDEGQICVVLASLADGTVLANAADPGGWAPTPSDSTFLLEAKDGNWTWREVAPVKPTSGKAGALIDGRCDLHPHCGKVLVAGSGGRRSGLGTTAQLYSPPA